MSIAEVRKLPRRQKIRLMEALWKDLTRNEDDIESPKWHLDELRKTERLVKSGKARFLDWDEAKKRLRRQAAKSA